MLLSVLLAVAPAPPGDWFERVWTPSGVEVRVDERVLALFTAFNAAGLDEGTAGRTRPVPRVRYAPLRARVRALAAGTPLAARIDAFFDAHQVPAESYLAASLGGPDDGLGGLGALLTEVWEAWPVGAAVRGERPALRAAMISLVRALEEPLGRTGLLASSTAIVVVNPLDAPGRVRGVQVKDDLVVTAGPEARVADIVAELVRLRLEPAAERVRWKEGPAVLKEARALGAVEDTPGRYAAAVIARAVALTAIAAPDAEWDAAARSGYFVPRDLGQVAREGRPIEPWLLEALGRVEKARTGKR